MIFSGFSYFRDCVTTIVQGQCSVSDQRLLGTYLMEKGQQRAWNCPRNYGTLTRTNPASAPLAAEVETPYTSISELSCKYTIPIYPIIFITTSFLDSIIVSQSGITTINHQVVHTHSCCSFSWKRDIRLQQIIRFIETSGRKTVTFYTTKISHLLAYNFTGYICYLGLIQVIWSSHQLSWFRMWTFRKPKLVILQRKIRASFTTAKQNRVSVTFQLFKFLSCFNPKWKLVKYS